MPEIPLQTWLVILAMTLTNVAIGLWWFGWPKPVRIIKEWISASPARTTVLTFSIAIGLWAGIFLIYKFPVTSDVAVYFQPQARAIRAGGIPNVDFQTAFMPLFPYLMAAVDWIWPHILAIPLFFMFTHVLSGLVVRRMAICGGENPVRSSALMMIGIFNGAAWLLSIGWQQDESLLVLFTALGMLMVLRGREGSAGAVLAIGLLTTKILFVIPASAVILQSRNIFRIISAFALTFIPIMSLFLLLGFDPLLMIRNEVKELIPPNVTALIVNLPPVYPHFMSAIGIAHFVGAAFWMFQVFRLSNVGKAPELKRMLQAVLAGWLSFLLISPKSWTYYRVAILPFLPLVISKFAEPRRWLIVLFCVYSTVLGIFWTLHEDMISGHGKYHRYFTERLEPELFVAFSIELVLVIIVVVSEIVWLWLCMKKRGLFRPIQ